MTPRRSDAASRLRVIVMGYLIRGPLGGNAWQHLQYTLGLHELGHDVYFLEDSDDYPSCYDPSRNVTDEDPTYGLAFTKDAFDRLGLGDRWAYHDAHTGRWHGPRASGMRRICRSADLLINISAVNPLRPWVEGIPARAFIDTDPAFVQIRHLAELEARRLAEAHTAFFTFGENIPGGRSTVPDDGLPWRPTRQPVVLSAWPVGASRPRRAYTTVMLWDSYEEVRYGDRLFGQKSHSFQRYLDLPARVSVPLQLAVGSPSAPRSTLRRNGWGLRDPLKVTRDPWTYQRFLQSSRGELAVAKHGYVTARTGWFSERTCGYLASGRPALVQETGLSDWLPTGEGLLTFGSPSEAVAGIDEIEARYGFHSRTARSLVEEYFDARRVLSRLVEDAFVRRAPAGRPR